MWSSIWYTATSIPRYRVDLICVWFGSWILKNRRVVAVCDKNKNKKRNAFPEPLTTKRGPENASNIAIDSNLALQTLKRGLEVRRMHRVQVLSLASPSCTIRALVRYKYKLSYAITLGFHTLCTHCTLCNKAAICKSINSQILKNLKNYLFLKS
jgi:hypothetical protein